MPETLRNPGVEGESYVSGPATPAPAHPADGQPIGTFHSVEPYAPTVYPLAVDPAAAAGAVPNPLPSPPHDVHLTGSA